MQRRSLIQARVTPEEINIIKEKAKESGMTTSDYLRASAMGVQLQASGNSREILRELCQLYTVVNQMEESENKDRLLKGVNSVCRYLES